MIEIRYEGALIGRSAIVRELDTRGLFLGITEPMPVGTSITLKIGDEVVSGRVAAVSEAQELARAGMRVTFAEPAAAAFFGTPVAAAPQAESVSAPAPVAETNPPAPAGASAAAAPEPATSSAAVAEASAGHRRIVVDASTERPVEGAVEAADNVEVSGPVTEDERIPAPDPSAFGGGKKNRRNKRR